MAKAESGNVVKVHYKGTLDTGDVFDSSYEREPLKFQLGSGQVIPGFENAILGMETSEKKSISIEPDQAYGQRNEEMVRAFPADQIPAEMSPKVGDTLALTTQDGKQIPARVTALDEQNITLDLNHPLAGQKLNFELELMEVGDAPAS